MVISLRIGAFRLCIYKFVEICFGSKDIWLSVRYALAEREEGMASRTISNTNFLKLFYYNVCVSPIPW